MVHNIISPIVSRGAEHCTLARFDIHHALPSNTNALIGRAAHIAVLDSELFIEKFLVISILKYFQWNCWHWINTQIICSLIIWKISILWIPESFLLFFRSARGVLALGAEDRWIGVYPECFQYVSTAFAHSFVHSLKPDSHGQKRL